MPFITVITCALSPSNTVAVLLILTTDPLTNKCAVEHTIVTRLPTLATVAIGIMLLGVNNDTVMLKVLLVIPSSTTKYSWPATIPPGSVPVVLNTIVAPGCSLWSALVITAGEAKLMVQVCVPAARVNGLVSSSTRLAVDPAGLNTKSLT